MAHDQDSMATMMHALEELGADASVRSAYDSKAKAHGWQAHIEGPRSDARVRGGALVAMLPFGGGLFAPTEGEATGVADSDAPGEDPDSNPALYQDLEITMWADCPHAALRMAYDAYVSAYAAVNTPQP